MKNKLIRLLIFVIMVAGISLAINYHHQLDIASIQSWITRAGSAAPLLFMFIYITATVFFFPATLLTLLGGALFGPVAGTFYNLTAATTGSALSFLISRYLAADWIEKKTGGKLKRLINGVEKEGWRFVAFTRLVPLFPFNFLNYGLGLTKIKLTHFTLASFIFMLPGALAYTWLGYLGKEAATGGEGMIQKMMLGIALLAFVAFLPRIIGHLREGKMLQLDALKQRLDNGEDFLLLDVRTEKDFHGEQGHIAGARLLPLDELEDRLDEINEYLEKPVVTICRTDKKSCKAALYLAEQGFADVHVAATGMTGWLKKHYPVEV